MVVVRFFFGMIALAAVFGMIFLMRNVFSREEIVNAVVVAKKREVFPASLMGSHRKKFSYMVTFRLLREKEQLVKMEVSESAFQNILPDAEGILSHKGEWFTSFTDDCNIITKDGVLSRGNAELY